MYSDSARDLPLLLVARRAVMVEPRDTDLRRVQRRLPAVEVLGQEPLRGPGPG
jgi:phosphoserine phosphatase